MGKKKSAKPKEPPKKRGVSKASAPVSAPVAAAAKGSAAGGGKGSAAGGGARPNNKKKPRSLGARPNKKQPAAAETAGESMGLEECFVSVGGEAVEANADEWARFWAGRPTVVAIDAEGTHFSPPLLVQIASDNRVLLEVPRNGKLSADMTRLLADASITKVFFGNPKNEKLGAPMHGMLVDVQARAKLPGGQMRGLANVASSSLGLGEFTKNTTLQRSFGWYRARQNGYGWLSPAQRVYAAADAWATLRIFDAQKAGAGRQKPSAPAVPARNRSGSAISLDFGQFP